MAERIKYEGRDATAGGCRGCKRILIVTDKDANGDYCTYHEDPMCEWYIEQCSKPTVQSTGLHVATHENVEFINPVK